MGKRCLPIMRLSVNVGAGSAPLWGSYTCPIAMYGMIASCSAPVDGGATCGASVALAALSCGVSIPAMFGVINNCF